VLHHQRWDQLETSGWLVLLIGLEVAALAPVRVDKAMQRLLHRDVLRAPAQAIRESQSDLEQAGHTWSVAGGWCVSLVLLLTWPLVSHVAGHWHSWAFGPAVTDEILVLLAGAIAGGWLGRMTGYGRLGTILAKRGLQLRVVPGHPDGAGGLRPIGDFYLYQSFVASLPATFVAVWVLLISLGGRNSVWRHYRPYLYQYLWLLALAILFEVLVFLLPLRSIHLIMKKQKEEVLLAEADRLSPLIEAAQAQREAEANEDGDTGQRQLARLVQRYKDLEKTPTWPIDPSIRRRFTLRNLGLLVPFAGYLVGQAPFWQQISDVFKGLG